MNPRPESWRAVKARREIDLSRFVVRPRRPAAQWQRTQRLKCRRFDLLLGHLEIAGRLAVLDPVDENAEHIDIGGRARADMIDAGRRIETGEFRRLLFA